MVGNMPEHEGAFLLELLLNLLVVPILARDTQTGLPSQYNDGLCQKQETLAISDKREEAETAHFPVRVNNRYQASHIKACGDNVARGSGSSCVFYKAEIPRLTHTAYPASACLLESGCLTSASLT